jgi:hypothetical protein
MSASGLIGLTQSLVRISIVIWANLIGTLVVHPNAAVRTPRTLLLCHPERSAEGRGVEGCEITLGAGQGNARNGECADSRVPTSNVRGVALAIW